MKNEKTENENNKNTSSPLVKYLFQTRFFLFGLTKKSKTIKKIFDKVFFEDNELFILPNKSTVNKSNTKITANIEIKESFQKDDSEFLPSEILKEIIHEVSSGCEKALAGLTETEEMVKKAGYEAQVISGIPSFCAAAAEIGLSIAEGDDAVLITAGEYKPFDGTLIIMKAGSKLKELKSHIQDCEKTAYLIENCGMQDEKIYSGLDEIPDKSGYFSILIVK